MFIDDIEDSKATVKPIWETAPDKPEFRHPSFPKPFNVCVLPSCGSFQQAKRLCAKHYMAAKRGKLDPVTGLSLKNITQGEQVDNATSYMKQKGFPDYNDYVYLMANSELMNKKTGVRITLYNAMNIWGPIIKDAVQSDKFDSFMLETWDPDPNFKSDTYYNSYQPLESLVPSVAAQEPLHEDLEFLLKNLFGTDVEWFKNWLSYKITHPWECTGAIVLNGIQGAGKGVLEKLMHELFGKQCSSIDSLCLEEAFNNWADRKFMIVADEINTSHTIKRETIRKQLKKYTAPNMLSINKKNVPQFQTKNHASWIICSNDKQVVDIEYDDRRFSAFTSHTPIKPELGKKIADNSAMYGKNLVNHLFFKDRAGFDHLSSLKNAARSAMQSSYNPFLKVVDNEEET